MANSIRPRERPSVFHLFPCQPEPAAVLIARDHHSNGCTTALVRLWHNGDAANCHLCPLGRCRAYAGVCLVQVRLDVPDEDARMFSTVGLHWTDGPTGGIFVPRGSHGTSVPVEETLFQGFSPPPYCL
jgi:hypothetical protein